MSFQIFFIALDVCLKTHSHWFTSLLDFPVSPVIYNVDFPLSIYLFLFVSLGGAAECGSEFVSEGLVFHHHHPGRYSQVFLRHQCHPCGQWIPADGENRAREKDKYINLF